MLLVGQAGLWCDLHADFVVRVKVKLGVARRAQDQQWSDLSLV